LATASHEITLVRGLPRARATSGFAPPAWETHNFADAGLLSNLLSRVDLVICRSGYSTMMDLRAMGKPAILIPTPGQTEQIYLAQRAESQGWVAVLQQDEVPRILGLIGQWKAVSVKNR
jgi:UDP-N-acetylglucosamine:LPS N-acetylglucosamine transferase